MAWHLAPALTFGRSEVDRRWPNRDKASDGTIGDAAHAQTQSDHNPNARGSVNAWDMDVNGPDVELVKRAFERHPSSHYWIHNRLIADRDNGWKPVPYNGKNPHTGHVHFSIRQAEWAEQDKRPWGIYPVPEPPEEADMTPEQHNRLKNVEQQLSALLSGRKAVRLWDGDSYVEQPNVLFDTLADVQLVAHMTRDGVNALANRPPVDPMAFVTALINTPDAVRLLYAALDERLVLVPTVQEIVKATMATLRNNVLSAPVNGE